MVRESDADSVKRLGLLPLANRAADPICVREVRPSARARDCAVAFGVALVVFAIHFASPVVTSFDSRWTIHTAASIAHRGDTDLDEYEELLREEDYYAIERRGGHKYNRYPLGASLVALPAVLLLDQVAAVLPVPSTEELIAQRRAVLLEVAVASAVVAMTAALLFLIARECGLGMALSVVVAAVFAFCTPAWSTASRGLWQHGPSMLMLSAALYFLLRARERPAWAILAALPLAFGLVVRPTNAVPLVLFTAYVVWWHSRQAIAYFALVALVLVPFVAFNLDWYGRPLSPYYYPSGQSVGTLSDVPLTALGHLVSPNRGILVFSPVLAFAVFGGIAKLRKRTFDALDAVVAATLAGHFAMISAVGQWWAGHSFGPRFWTDVVPLLIYFLIFAIGAAEEMDMVTRRRFAIVFALLCGWSFFAHFRAATDWDVWAWNGSPVSIDDRPERAWDWSDLQILRGMGHRRA